MLSQTHHHHHLEMDKAVFDKKAHNDMFGFAFGEEIDDFSVDDLFDFPETNDFETDAVKHETVQVANGETRPCVSVKLETPGGGFSPTEISVPADDVAELEWLSQFVDDSFTEYSLAYPGDLHQKTILPPTTNNHRLFPRPATKPRGKRSRCSGKSWSLSTSDNTTTSSSSSNSTSTSTSRPSVKRQKRKLEGGVRRCSHCGVQKTPQWRQGPEGAKTLCNACGVRFKSGRLCPEYRPACSPSFCSDLHSNKHRKVVEMRRRKEVETAEGLVVVC